MSKQTTDATPASSPGLAFSGMDRRKFALSEWVSPAPPQLMMDHLRISPDVLKAIPRANSVVMPTGPSLAGT